MSITKKVPNVKNIVRPAFDTRRDHPHAACVGGSTILASPAAAIEANAGAAKRLTPTMVHPSHAGNANRGFATRKGVEPAAPINASPTTGRPTRAPAVTFGAEGVSGMPPYDPAPGDEVLAEAFATANNRLPGENHHSTVTPQAIVDQKPRR